VYLLLVKTTISEGILEWFLQSAADSETERFGLPTGELRRQASSKKKQKALERDLPPQQNKGRLCLYQMLGSSRVRV